MKDEKKQKKEVLKKEMERSLTSFHLDLYEGMRCANEESSGKPPTFSALFCTVWENRGDRQKLPCTWAKGDGYLPQTHRCGRELIVL